MYILNPYKKAILSLSLLAAVFFANNASATSLNVNTDKRCEYYFSVYEKKFQIPQHLLKAISLQESGLWQASARKQVAWPWTMNAKGKGYRFDSMTEAVAAASRMRASGVESFDVGCMQVNMYYHPDAFRDLNQAFDPKYNVAYAAYMLRKLYEESGSWDTAVAHYHSKTSSRGEMYVRKVRKIWHRERNTSAVSAMEENRPQQGMVFNQIVIANYPVSKPKPPLPSFEISRN